MISVTLSCKDHQRCLFEERKISLPADSEKEPVNIVGVLPKLQMKDGTAFYIVRTAQTIW